MSPPKKSMLERANEVKAVPVGVISSIIGALVGLLASPNGLELVRELKRSEAIEKIVRVSEGQARIEASLTATEKAVDRLSMAMWRRGVMTNQITIAEIKKEIQ
jgi:hypothetical protein